MYVRKSVSLTDDLVALIELRDQGNFSGVINSHLTRYFTALKTYRNAWSVLLSEQRAAFLIDALRGDAFDGSNIKLIGDLVALESVERDLVNVHDVDVDAVVALLKTITPFAIVALVDAIELWRLRVADGDDAKLHDILAS
ncbi:MAG: hypothetical protein WBC13_06400 [Dokdonella sp.]|nr:hypothetical protein [Cellvibrionales bacterium]